MPKYKCKVCGAIWYGWEAKENPICQKCGGKLEPDPEDNADKKIGRASARLDRGLSGNPRLWLSSRT